MCGLLRPNEDEAPPADAPKPIASQTTLQTRIPGICTHCYGDLELPIHPPGFCFFCNHRQPSEEEREQFWNNPAVLPCVQCEADVKGLKFCSGCGSKGRLFHFCASQFWRLDEGLPWLLLTFGGFHSSWSCFWG